MNKHNSLSKQQADGSVYNEEGVPHGDCHVERLEKAVSAEALQSATLSVLAVMGMGCPNCALRVHNALLSLPSVYNVKVDLERALAFVRWNSSLGQIDHLIESVSEAALGTCHEYRAFLLESSLNSV